VSQPPVRNTSVIESVLLDGTSVGSISAPSDVAVDQVAPAVAVGGSHVCHVWQLCVAAGERGGVGHHRRDASRAP